MAMISTYASGSTFPPRRGPYDFVDVSNGPIAIIPLVDIDFANSATKELSRGRLLSETFSRRQVLQPAR